jgi:hypothetical protein
MGHLQTISYNYAQTGKYAIEAVMSCTNNEPGNSCSPEDLYYYVLQRSVSKDSAILRAIQKVISHLKKEGYVEVRRQGRKSNYFIIKSLPGNIVIGNVAL